MGNSIPDYSETFSSVQQVLENASEASSCTKRRALSSVHICQYWTANHGDVFNRVKEKIETIED